MRTGRWLCLSIAFIMILASPLAFAAKGSDIEAEKELGKQGSTEAEKSLKFITDEKYTKRVEAIGSELAAIAKTVKVPATYGSAELADFNYTFKVVDDKDVNAFSLPAGYIYVNKGLLDRVESDDELAGVLAHEIAHASHHHMLELLRKKSLIDRGLFLLIAAAALGNVRSSDAANIIYGAQLVQIAKMNSYSQEAEHDADKTAILYMLKTKYNPVGMLTFIEKLAREHAYDPVDPGILRTHPLSKNRAENLIAELKARKIPIDRRAVTTGTLAVVRDATVDEKTVSEVVIGSRTVFRPADMQGRTSQERAASIAERLNRMLRLNPAIRDVKLGVDGTDVYVLEELVVDVRPVDARLNGASEESLAVKAKESIQAALLSEQMLLMY